ncbi:MAG TPA: hypothetical protein PLT40_08790, partial [Ilumatobacteraceae bacterium]|nr:hypothetical protein [Ilumatobacteraceae bacterium]
MDPAELAVVQQREVQVRDVAEPDEGLGVGPNGCEVDLIGDSVRPGPSPGSNDGSDLRVPERLVEVIESVRIGAGHVTPLVEDMRCDFTAQPPAIENREAVVDRSSIGRAGRRHKPNAVTRPQPRCKKEPGRHRAIQPHG